MFLEPGYISTEGLVVLDGSRCSQSNDSYQRAVFAEKVYHRGAGPLQLPIKQLLDDHKIEAQPA